MKYVVEKGQIQNEFGTEEVYRVFMQNKNEDVLDCYFYSEQKANEYARRMNDVGKMDTEEIREAISKEDKSEILNQIEQMLYDIECDLLKAVDNKSFIEEARIKTRNAIKFVDKNKS